MNRQDGQWQCFMCERKGNKHTFIQEIHRNWLEQTTPAHYNSLRELRKFAIDIEELQMMEFAFNAVTQEWQSPAWDSTGKLKNLYVWRKSFDPDSGKERRQFMSSPLMHHVPYGVHRLRPDTQRRIWVCEGQWDYLALVGLFRRLNFSQKYDVIASPGSGAFPADSVHIFNGRHMALVYDNDTAGRNGMDKLIDVMARKFVMPVDCQRIEWPSGLKDGFDVSDVVTSLPQGLWPKPTKEKK